MKASGVQSIKATGGVCVIKKPSIGQCLALQYVAVGLISTIGAAHGQEQSNWMVRVRALGVIPVESATVHPIGGDVSVDDGYMPEVDVTYFFTDHIAFEYPISTTRHAVGHSAFGSLGKVSILAPTPTVQYHFTPDAKIKPYVGAGLNYTFFYNKDEVPGLPVDYDNGWGWALQAGVDIKVKGNWSLNMDVKRVFLKTEAKVMSGAVTADVTLDPWALGMGVGYRF